MHIGVYLIALALGFKLFVDATKEAGTIRTVGRILGIFVILLALGGSICGLFFKYSACWGKAGCSWMGKCMHMKAAGPGACPMAGK